MSMMLRLAPFGVLRLASLYFDRRMLNAARRQLVRCKELAETSFQLEATRRSAARVEEVSRESDIIRSGKRREVEIATLRQYDDSRYEETFARLDGILYDLGLLKGFQNRYCTLTEEVKVLPCLYSRFHEDDVHDCETWWTEIRTTNKFIW